MRSNLGERQSLLGSHRQRRWLTSELIRDFGIVTPCESSVNAPAEVFAGFGGEELARFRVGSSEKVRLFWMG